MAVRLSNNFRNQYLSELTLRIVAESGIESDRFHLGKIIFQALQDFPDHILQIDGGTGEQVTNGSVLARSVQCACAFRKLGLRRGDVIVLMTPNHLDLCIPFYAALFLGITVAPIDRSLTIRELQEIFKVDEAKIIFCQHEQSSDVQSTLDTLKMVSRIVTFDEGPKFINFKNFLIEHGNVLVTDKFRLEDFDPVETAAFLMSTSGTTGIPKQSLSSHKNVALGFSLWLLNHTEFPTPTKMGFAISPLQWMSAIHLLCLTSIFTYTLLQTSLDLTQQHAYDLINKYKPTMLISSPKSMKFLLGKDDRSRCDLNCFKDILLGGSAVSGEFITELQNTLPNTYVYSAYGMSEANAVIFNPHTIDPGSCGTPLDLFEYRMMDIKTGIDINEPNVIGELWIRGPTVTKGYYKNPEATKDAFAEGNWLMTGDLFYRDENWNFFFVERIKRLLKYNNHHVSPTELENLIHTLPDVLDVAVTGVPDDECGDLPVACVIRRPGSNLTAAQIKQLVKDNLTDSKQLRGGVVFIDQLPLTPSSKVHKKHLDELVKKFPRE